MRYRHYELSLDIMAMGILDYEQGVWRVGKVGCSCNECKSFYAAGYAYALNCDLLTISSYGTIT